MKSIFDIENYKGKRVLVRADLNVPLKDTAIVDDTRIQAALETINFLIKNSAKIILCSHLGRPKGFEDKHLSLAPVAKHLGELLNRTVHFTNKISGEEVTEKSKNLRDGEILLIENLRFDSREKANDENFSKELASLCDIYVNDAFGTAHRAHASTVGVTKFVNEKACGALMKKELDTFKSSFEESESPFVAIFGGVKASTKIAAMKHVATKANCILVGGAMANTFLAAKGYEVGKSLHEPEEFKTTKEVEEIIEKNSCKLLLPVDFVCAKEFSAEAEKITVDAKSIPKDQMALDIGPKTVELFSNEISKAKTVIWNGPMGAFETKGFESGTFGIVDALVNKKDALTVVGGGDTDYALHQRHAFDKVSYVSTGGGAFLTLLEGTTLPAIAALEK